MTICACWWWSFSLNDLVMTICDHPQVASCSCPSWPEYVAAFKNKLHLFFLPVLLGNDSINLTDHLIAVSDYKCPSCLTACDLLAGVLIIPGSKLKPKETKPLEAGPHDYRLTCLKQRSTKWLQAVQNPAVRCRTRHCRCSTMFQCWSGILTLTFRTIFCPLWTGE